MQVQHQTIRSNSQSTPILKSYGTDAAFEVLNDLGALIKNSHDCEHIVFHNGKFRKLWYFETSSFVLNALCSLFGSQILKIFFIFLHSITEFCWDVLGYFSNTWAHTHLSYEDATSAVQGGYSELVRLFGGKKIHEVSEHFGLNIDNKIIDGVPLTIKDIKTLFHSTGIITLSSLQDTFAEVKDISKSICELKECAKADASSDVKKKVTSLLRDIASQFSDVEINFDMPIKNGLISTVHIFLKSIIILQSIRATLNSEETTSMGNNLGEMIRTRINTLKSTIKSEHDSEKQIEEKSDRLIAEYVEKTEKYFYRHLSFREMLNVCQAMAKKEFKDLNSQEMFDLVSVSNPFIDERVRDAQFGFERPSLIGSPHGHDDVESQATICSGHRYLIDSFRNQGSISFEEQLEVVAKMLWGKQTPKGTVVFLEGGPVIVTEKLSSGPTHMICAKPLVRKRVDGSQAPNIIHGLPTQANTSKSENILENLLAILGSDPSASRVLQQYSDRLGGPVLKEILKTFSKGSTSVFEKNAPFVFSGYSRGGVEILAMLLMIYEEHVRYSGGVSLKNWTEMFSTKTLRIHIMNAPGMSSDSAKSFETATKSLRAKGVSLKFTSSYSSSDSVPFLGTSPKPDCARVTQSTGSYNPPFEPQERIVTKCLPQDFKRYVFVGDVFQQTIAAFWGLSSVHGEPTPLGDHRYTVLKGQEITPPPDSLVIRLAAFLGKSFTAVYPRI